MSASITPRSLFRRQLGAASVGIAILIMFILVAAVTAVMNMSGSSVIDAAKNEEQVAALFLAESGVERARAVITAASLAGAYTDTTCTNLATVTGSLPRGTFTYTATALPTPCGGANPSCTSCTVESTGAITGTQTRRTVRTVISSTEANGVFGCADSFTLSITVPPGLGAAAVFTNVGFRAKPVSACPGAVGNSNASIATCTNSSGNPCSVTSWLVTGTGTGAVNSTGIYATVPASPTSSTIYSLNLGLTDSGGAAKRAFSATGVVLFPAGGTGTVGFTGAYGEPTNDTSTESASGLSGNVSSEWTCQPRPFHASGGSKTIADWSMAANSDTLFYGFTGLGTPISQPGDTNEVTTMFLGDPSLGKQQPLYRLISLTDGLEDILYSQSWMAYNPRYWATKVSGGVTVPHLNATNGPNFIGTIGSSFTGTIIGASNPRTLTLTSAANLAPGSRITNSTGTILYGTMPATAATGTWGANGSTYSITSTAEVNPAASLRAYDVLTLISTTANSGTFTIGDTFINNNTSQVYGKIGVQSPDTGAPGSNGSTYFLDSSNFSSNPNFFVPSPTDMSAGITIHVPLSTAPAPTPGTALGISSNYDGNNGSFDATAFTGTISGTALTISSGGVPNVGDRLYGTYVKLNTLITGKTDDTHFTVTPNQTTSQAGPMLARVAVRGADSSLGLPAPTATSFVVSKKPAGNLTGGAQLCGGVCPFFFPLDKSGSNYRTLFNVVGLPSGHDWASGFSCMSGVDPENVRFVARIIANQSSWSEPVR